MAKSPEIVAVKTPRVEIPLNVTTIGQGVATLLTTVEDYKKGVKKGQLFKDEALPIYIQIVPIKVPVTPKVELRVSLPNSMSLERDSCLIVKNVRCPGKKHDNEKTINHYQKLLKDIGIKGSIQVVPVGQLCDENKQYEEKSKFSRLYDTYLVDGRLLPVAGRTLGIRFSKAGKHLIPVMMQTKGLKARLEIALSKTVMTVHANGDTFCMKVGFTSMTVEQISENILAAMVGLCQKDMFPGGFNNIRSVRVKTARSMAIPIYISLKKSNKVKKPVRKVKIPKAYKVEEGELSTILGGHVRVNPEGDVHFRRVITGEDRKMLASADSDDLADNTKEEIPELDSDEEEVKKETKPLKRKVEDDESDDEGVEDAENTYMSERQGGFEDKESDEEEESADEAPVGKNKKAKKSPKSKK